MSVIAPSDSRKSQFLTPENLVDPRETIYFRILLVFSIVVWLVVAVTIFGLLYAALIGRFVWLGAGLFVARLRAEGVEVTAQSVSGSS